MTDIIALKSYARKFQFLIFLIVCIAVAFAWGKYRDRLSEQALRQLQGQLSAKEKEMQALDVTLGVTKAQLKSQSDIESQYDSTVKGKDAELDAFKKRYDLEVASLMNAVFNLKQELVKGGTAKVVVKTLPCNEKPSVLPVEDDSEVSYEYSDAYGRFHLFDANIFDKSEPDLKVNQSFRLIGVILRQDEGLLSTEQLVLEEVVQEGGAYKAIGKATLVDAKFDYASIEPKKSLWDFSLFAGPGSSFSDAHFFNFGAGLSILRLWKVTLGVDMLTDFSSWSGTGLGAVALWRPQIGSKYLNIGVGAGAVLSLGADKGRIQPYVFIPFFLY